MSLLAATQIPKPSDEQAFERASVVLWRGLLKDPNVQRNGRRGQRQNGVDIFGIRNSDPDYHVGIQCKLKGEGQVLTRDEVLGEVAKALTFSPGLKEYFIVTTAADDVGLQELARQLTSDYAKNGRRILIYVWGWNTLEEKISEDSSARKAFDPSFGPFSEKILDESHKIAAVQLETRADIDAGFSSMNLKLAEITSQLQIPPGDATKIADALEKHLDAEIDNYRQLATDGKPRTARSLLENLLNRVRDTASGRVLFRIKANIGNCLLALGDDEGAAKQLEEAYHHKPDEPKAIANRAFAFLLQGKELELLSFGQAALVADPTNEGLAGYVIQAARIDSSIVEPLNLVPEQLRKSDAVAVSRVDFIRRRGKPEEWWAAARETVAAHPHNLQATLFAAEADLDEILNSGSYERTRLLSPGERARLAKAVEVLAEQWDDVRRSEGTLRPEHVALCGNLIVACDALGDVPQAVKVANEGLQLAPAEVSLMIRTAAVALDNNDDNLARKLIDKLPASHERTVLGFRYHSTHGNWAEVARIAEQESEYIPEVERALISTVGKLAQAKIGPQAVRRERLKAIAGESAGNVRASVAVADFARMEKFEDVADAAFDAAFTAIDASSHIASRLMVAFHAAKRGDWSVVAELLDGHIVEDRDSEELRLLAQAFANDTPIRQRALRFFKRLVAEVHNLPFFLHAEGLVHFNRGALADAEASLRRAIAAQPDLHAYLALFQTLRRRGHDEEIKPILEEIDLTKVIGSPIERMQLAQTLRAEGLGSEAMPFAYETLRVSKNNPDAALRYLGFVMMIPDEGLIPMPESAGVDVWVRLASDDGQSHAFLIEEGEDRPAEGIISPSNPTAVAVDGLGVGDEFKLPAGFGDKRSWRVKELKHKYLHALHDVMENFEKRFPEAHGFRKITMLDGDITPALEQVRQASEGSRKRADLYLRQHVPLNMVAARSGGDTIGFAEYIESLDFDIRTSVGTETERLAARALVESYKSEGVVLDTYTAWTVATMDSFDILKGVFGNIVVAQSTIDELLALRDRLEVGPSMTVGWRDGQYIKQEHTPETIELRRSFISEQIWKIEANCDVQPATAPDDLSEEATLLTEVFGAHVLDAAHLANEQGILISEDLYFRRVSESACSVKAVWLQPIFSFALETGRIDSSRYVDTIVKLAWRRHAHLALEVGTLRGVFDTDESSDLSTFAMLAHFIGTQDADMASHVNVSKAFLDSLWRDSDQFDVRPMKATGILLEKLIRYRQDDQLMALVLLKNDAPSNLRDYIRRWIKGHFYSDAEISAAKNRFVEIEQQVTKQLLRKNRRQTT
jgi:tetratricopeptide (TPR) repeat protein